MGYKVDYGAMKNLLGAYSSVVSSWNNGISSVMGKEASLETSTNISGNSADRMKAYLNTVYSYADTSLNVLLELFRQNYFLYTEAYYQQIDAARDASINQAELSDRRSSLQEKRSKLQQIGLTAENTVSKVADLVSTPSLDISDVDAECAHVLTLLDDLDDAVNGLERTHVNADFQEIDELISRLDAYFRELNGLNKEFKTGFTLAGFAALSSVPALALAARNAYDQIRSQEPAVAIAAKNLEERLEQERAELEERKKKAEWIKIGANVAVGLLSAAFLVTAGPVGAIAIGAISGAVSATFSAAADEYAEKGWNTDDWNWKRIEVHGCIGAVTGMIGGAVAPGAGPFAKSSIKALSSAFEGAASTTYDQFEAHGHITDVGAIAGDALIKGGSTFIGSMIGSTVSDHVSDFVKQNGTIKDLSEHVVGGAKHFGAVLQVEGASELASGAAKRLASTATTETIGFVGSVLAGKTIAEAYDEHSIVSESFKQAVDVKSIVSDAASSVTTAATDNPLYASEKKLEYYRKDDYYLFGDSPDLNGKKDGWKNWNSEEFDRLNEKLREMEARGDDARNYELFGDPRTFSAQRSAAVDAAWEQERRLVLQGRGTRDWTVSQQEELIRTGRVSGFDGSHMLDASSNPSIANDPNNIQFLTYEEHIYGAHDGNTHNPTTGRFDPATGETDPLNPRQLPHREEVAFELSQKFDYHQADLAEQLGSSFGYDRGGK